MMKIQLPSNFLEKTEILNEKLMTLHAIIIVQCNATLTKVIHYPYMSNAYVNTSKYFYQEIETNSLPKNIYICQSFCK